ncbi:hypothetical protein [Spirosoma pomorum]
MAFTGNQKYGYTDGDQIGNHGGQFPIFARVRNGELYAVAREDNPSHPTPGRFGKLFTLSREFLKNTVFGAYKSDADVFSDKPQNVEDTSEPGSSFVLVNNTDTLIKRPNLGSTTPTNTNPTTTNPTNTNPNPTTTNPANTNPAQTGLTTTPSTSTSTTTVITPSTMTPTIKYSIIGVAVLVVAGIIYMVVSSSKRNGRRN